MFGFGNLFNCINDSLGHGHKGDSRAINDIEGFEVKDIVAAALGPEVNGVAGAGRLGIGGIGLVMGLHIATKGVLAMGFVIEGLSVDNLTRAVVTGNTVLSREVIELPGTLGNEEFHDPLGQCLVG